MDKIKLNADKYSQTTEVAANKYEQTDKIKIENQRTWPKIAGFIIIIFAGILSGYFLVNPSSNAKQSGKGGIFDNSKVVGSTNTQIFKDTAEGVLEVGGINGEGTHKLVRPGGDSQTAYLTSSVVNLDEYVGKKVKVWGETLAAQKAGWFMDVGRLEVQQ